MHSMCISKGFHEKKYLKNNINRKQIVLQYKLLTYKFNSLTSSSKKQIILTRK